MKRSFCNVDKAFLESRFCKPVEHAKDSDINQHISCWLKQYNDILDEVAPIKAFHRRRKKSPFVTQEIRQLMNQRTWIVRKLKNCHLRTTSTDPATLHDLSSRLRILKRQIKVG